MIDVADLHSRFMRDALAALADGPLESTFEHLVARYSEIHRCYHTLAHVDACLVWLDWCRGLAERPEEVALALWFHDAIYDPLSSDNERRSSEFARAELEALAVPGAAIERIVAHVLATAQHSGSGDGALVVDLDLTILAARPFDFERFERQIRVEYAHVPDPLFKAGRRQVLEDFVRRRYIYHLPQLRDALESRARTNLERRIAELA
jgi:predicted metal-dependent HD superfamily phosphohydrolase